eukprot:gb/GEZJ01000625.1/.p1 GENE.gb/GEZJ01000625.1/~~gb/GEZJ01000625.1/.p1  ORF type:complete len:578 (+),score=73.08 gb/GEZJ01000625.1/:3761-5494(+)
MYRMPERLEASVVATAGFPGVYPLPAVAESLPGVEQAQNGENPGKSIEGSLGEDAGAVFDSILRNGRSTFAIGGNTEQCVAVDGNDNNCGTDPVIEGLPNVNERFEDVLELGKIYEVDKDGRTSESIPGRVVEAQEPIDPASLPDEDYMDLMFAPRPRKDGAGAALEPTWKEFIETLTHEFSSNSPEEAEIRESEVVEDGNGVVPIDMSDEDYIDRMFAPLALEDRNKLVKNRSRRCSVNEYLAHDIAKDRRMCAERPPAALNFKPPNEIGNGIAREVPRKALRETHQVIRVGTEAQVSTETARDTIHGEARGSNRTTLGEGHDGDSQNKRTVPTAAHQRPSNPAVAKRVKRSAKRKRSPRRKATKVVKGEGEGRQPKRRRKRVEDMNPADVHFCDYEGCGKRFARKYNLTVHQRGHRDEFPFRCDLPHCGKSFMWHSSLSRHLRVHEKRRRLGGRKQRGSRRGKAYAKAQGSQTTGPADNPVAALKCEALRELETVQRLVSTVTVDQTMVALMGKQENRVGKDLNAKSQLEERWRQLGIRKQLLAGQGNSMIVMSNKTYLRLCEEILNSAGTGNAA